MPKSAETIQTAVALQLSPLQATVGLRRGAGLEKDVTLRHHPSVSMRSDYVSANLAPGAALAIEAHLQMCNVCAIAVDALSGGPATGDTRAIGKARRASFAPRPEFTDASGRRHVADDVRGRLSAGRPFGRGAWLFAVSGVSGLGESTYLVRARSHARLRLAGAEVLLVLDGHFTSSGVTFKAGDFLVLSEADIPAPVAGDEGCECLIIADDGWPGSPWRRIFLWRTRRRS